MEQPIRIAVKRTNDGMAITASGLGCVSGTLGVHSLTGPGETDSDVVRRCVSELRQSLSAQRRLKKERAERLVPPADVMRWLRRTGLAR